MRISLSNRNLASSNFQILVENKIKLDVLSLDIAAQTLHNKDEINVLRNMRDSIETLKINYLKIRGLYHSTTFKVIRSIPPKEPIKINKLSLNAPTCLNKCLAEFMPTESLVIHVFND